MYSFTNSIYYMEKISTLKKHNIIKPTVKWLRLKAKKGRKRKEKAPVHATTAKSKSYKEGSAEMDTNVKFLVVCSKQVPNLAG